MTTFLREPEPFFFDISVYSDQASYLWAPQWESTVGVPKVDFLLDVRNVVLGTSAAIALKPAIQYAATRIDRPDDGAALSAAGSDVTGNSLNHYSETLSAGSKLFFRRGIQFRLTAGSFARAQGVLYNAWISRGMILAPEEIVFNPTNDTSAVSYFPLGGGKPIPANGLSKAKLVVFGLDNLNNTMEWNLAARAFNDPRARGGWTVLGSWNTPSAGDFTPVNTGELDFTGITLSNFQWIELALAVRKGNDANANSRCIFHIIPALSYA